MSDTAITESPTPQLLGATQVAGGWIKKYILRYRLPNGTEIEYDAVSRKDTDAYLAELRANAAGTPRTRRADAVCIVPSTRDGRLVMLREFRYALNSWTVAFPAGLVEAGEDLEAAVGRELSEETGYELARDAAGNTHVRVLSQPGYSSAGMSEESVQIVYAQVENEPHEQHTEPMEFIEVFTLPVADVPRFLEENTVPMGTRAQLILEAFARNPER